jgi:hypothetical protein
MSDLRAGVAGLGVAALAFLVIAGTASGALPDKNGVFHGCVNKTTGALRLVGPRAHCKRGEKSVTFNQKGQPGTPGRNGSNGQNGTSVAARIRSTGPMTLSNSPQDYPLTANTWTQKANEFDVTFIKAVVSNPTNCMMMSGGLSFLGSMSAEVDLDGAALTTISSFASSTASAPLLLTVPIFEPGASTNHALTITKAQDNCTSGGHYSLDSVSIDVAAMQ